MRFGPSSVCALLSAISLAAFSPAHAASGAGKLVIGYDSPNVVCEDVSEESRYVNYLCIHKLEVDWSADLLLGEPKIFNNARWYLSGPEGFEGTRPLEGKARNDICHLLYQVVEAEQPVMEALAELTVSNVSVAAEVVYDAPKDATRASLELYQSLPGQKVYLTFQMGVLGGPGQSGFNTPRVPDWDKTFTIGHHCVHGKQAAPYLSAASAKAIFKNGFTLEAGRICGLEFGGIPALDSALARTCQAWEPTTLTYRKCKLRCEEGAKPNKDFTACIKEKKVVRISEKPAEKRPEMVDQLERDLMAAIAPEGPKGAALLDTPRKFRPEPGTQSALRDTGKRAPYGISQSRWEEIQKERAADLNSLGPQWEQARFACSGDWPKAPEKPFLSIVLYTTDCDEDCRSGHERRRREELEERLDDWRREMEDHEAQVREWERDRDACLVKAEAEHNRRVERMKQSHANDDKRLAEIEELSKQLREN